MLSRGYLTVGRIARAPVRVHLATPLGLFVFTGFTLHPILWAGFFLIILVHELGHALLVRAYRLRILSIDIHGMGGRCEYAGRPAEVEEAIIAWGGVLAQLVLLAVTEGVGKTIGYPEGIVAESAAMLTASNLFLMAVNLLPLPPLDGYKAWTVFRWRNIQQLRRRQRAVGLKSRIAAIERELAGIDDQRARRESSRPDRWVN